MPSNEQRRQAAKRKLERQLARRAERAKRRRLIAVISTVGAVVVVVGGIYFVATSGHGSSTASADTATTSAAPTTTTAAGVATSGPCKYTTTPGSPAPTGKNVGVPADPNPTPKTGTVNVTLQTNFGNVPLTLNRAQAPCTVQSFLHLVTTKFYDKTPCHRETAYPAPTPLQVLQCGDPTGTGSGGPGYTIPDEKPTNLKAAPANPQAPGEVIYPRGTLAMAKSSAPNSGGSQFFLVTADSYLTPDYTVFGTIDPAGLTVLDQIAAKGITPGSSGSAQDGSPTQPVTIKQAVVS